MDNFLFHNFSVAPSYADVALNKDISIICKHKVIADTVVKSFLYRRNSKGTNIDSSVVEHIMLHSSEKNTFHYISLSVVCCKSSLVDE